MSPVRMIGMGRDGQLGLKAMPRAAVEVGAFVRQLPLEAIGSELVRHCRARH